MPTSFTLSRGRSLSVGIAVVVGLFVTGALVVSGQEKPQAQRIPSEAEPPRTETIRPYMHAKLYHSQMVLQGLVTKDYGSIEQGAEALRRTSLEAPWPDDDDSINRELYDHFKLEFLRLSTRLAEQARQENLDGAAFTYQNMTANCMACHHYLSEYESEE